MYDFPIASYESLKASVLLTSEQTAIASVDCDLHKRPIFVKTGISLGVSSLLQVYGQKVSRFHPSHFTLNTLANYQAGLNWNEWCDKHNARITCEAADLKWQLLKDKADKVSAFTLQVGLHNANLHQSRVLIDN